MLRKIAPCFFAIVIDALGFGLVYPVMAAIFTATHSPVLTADVSLATRHFYLGVSYMLYPLCMFFGASFMGDLSDNWGRKKVLLVCMLGITISFGLMAMAVVWSSLTLLFLGRALSGLMAGSQPIAQASIADLSTPETKAVNMSFIALSYSFGAVLGPLIGGVMSDQALLRWFNFSTPFAVAALLAAISYSWLWFGFKETSLIKSRKKISLLRPIQIFIAAFNHPTVRYLTIVFLLMQIGFSVYFQFIIIYMQSAYNYSNWQMGAFQGMLGLGFALGLLVGMPLALKYFSVKRIATMAIALTGLGQLIVAVIPSASLQWLIAIFIALFDIMGFSAMLTLFSNAVDEKSQGWVMGITGGITALGAGVASLLAGLLAAFNLMLPLIIAVCLILLGCFLLWFWKQKLETI